MCQGLTYKAIADELVVSYHTVKKHVQNIYGSITNFVGFPIPLVALSAHIE